MELELSKELEKDFVFKKIAEFLKSKDLPVIEEDQSRPWGGFFVIDEKKAVAFAEFFFPDIKLSDIQITNKLSPKILIVAPNKRLSWQYHFRRAEIWKILFESVGIKTSPTDQEGDLQFLNEGTIIQMDKGIRHRLIGLDSWGVVAEIWQHTDADNPSNEDDIVRLQDDFGR